jgi:hypothetical protein
MVEWINPQTFNSHKFLISSACWKGTVANWNVPGQFFLITSKTGFDTTGKAGVSILSPKIYNILKIYFLSSSVCYHSGGSMKLNARILHLAHMVYL